MYLKEIRESKGITQQQLADKLGLMRNTISRYETGDREPDQDTLIEIARVLDVTVDYLLTGEDTKKEPTTADELDVKVALFGGDGEVTDEMWEEAINYAQYIKERERKKKEQP